MLHFVLIAIQFKKLLFTQWKIGSLQNKPKDKFGGFCNILDERNSGDDSEQWG
jgi:hypothetical protein